MKYTLLKNKQTGERKIRIVLTGEEITEKDNPTRYKELRKKAILNLRRKDKDETMKDLGLTKVKGNLGGTYWE